MTFYDNLSLNSVLLYRCKEITIYFGGVLYSSYSFFCREHLRHATLASSGAYGDPPPLSVRRTGFFFQHHIFLRLFISHFVDPVVLSGVLAFVRFFCITTFEMTEVAPSCPGTGEEQKTSHFRSSIHFLYPLHPLSDHRKQPCFIGQLNLYMDAS